MSYVRFGAMIVTSTIVMFILMYLNTYALEHVYFSETRAYMALVMGATMAVIMLAFMLGMYKNTALNIAIFVGSVLVFAGALYLVRSQVTVDQVSYMKAMIPHHSIAIMTSERADIRDPRVRKLADEIIEAQRREIGEMKDLIAGPREQGLRLPTCNFRGAIPPAHPRGGGDPVKGDHRNRGERWLLDRPVKPDDDVCGILFPGLSFVITGASRYPATSRSCDGGAMTSQCRFSIRKHRPGSRAPRTAPCSTSDGFVTIRTPFSRA